MDRSYDIIICILVGTNLGMETERDSKSDKEDDKESKMMERQKKLKKTS